MGCGKSSVRSNYTVPVIRKEDVEIDEVIALPLNAHGESLDLIQVVELHDILDKGRTEIISDSTDPSFITSFHLTYCFEKQERVIFIQFQFKVYDLRTSPDRFEKTNCLGSAEFNIHEVICSESHSITRVLDSARKTNSTITVTSEELSRVNHTIKMTWTVLKANTFFMYLMRISRVIDDKPVPIYQSESLKLVKGNCFAPIEISLNTLCRGDTKRPVLLELLELQKKGVKTTYSHLTTLEDLKQKGLNYQADFTQTDRPLCTLGLILFEYIERSSFLDYVLGGCEISLLIGIDFTKSNGDPKELVSLHHIDESKPNEYLQAIQGVGDILQYYDSDKKIPVYGFGAKLPTSYTHVSHCFALNGNIFDPEVNGIKEVKEVYQKTLREVILHGPTIFSQLIEMASIYASAKESSQEQQQYFILLILTDGIINDMEFTKDELVRASELPLSVIIVGIGDEDFSLMKLLDSDEGLLYSKKLQKTACRDIVQFVPFSSCKGRPEMLAREVLYEIPNQVIEYMTSKGIKPNKAITHQEVANSHRSAMSSRRFSQMPSPMYIHPSSMLLLKHKHIFMKKLEDLGLTSERFLDLVDEGVPCMDPSIIAEYFSTRKTEAPSLRPILKRPDKQIKTLPPIRHETISSKLKICKICKERNADVILLDCGHRVVCESCVRQVGSECPECRNTVVKWLSVYNN